MPTLTFARTPASVIAAARDVEVEQLGRRDRARRRAAVRSGSAASPRTASKHSGRERNEVGMRDPGAVEAVAGLALLVVAHLRQRLLVHLRVAPGRDERRHPADRMRAAPVAGLHEQLRVGAHERDGHRHLRAVGQNDGRVAQLLDAR